MCIESILPDKAISELDYVRLAKEDDPVAFAALLERYMPILHARVRRYSQIDGVDTDDLLQEGMLALYRAVKGYDISTQNQFNTYAITCINNSMTSAIKTHIRNLRKSSSVNLDEIDEHHLHKLASRHNVEVLLEDVFIGKETFVSRLGQIEQLLTNLEQQVLKLYLGGKTYEQISRTLGKSTKTVDNALQRVRRKLRPKL